MQIPSPKACKTIDETNYRRTKQMAYNETHKITPKALNKSLDNALASNSIQTYVQEREERKVAEAAKQYQTPEDMEKAIREMRKAMEKAAKELDFIEAARLRDAIEGLKAALTS